MKWLTKWMLWVVSLLLVTCSSPNEDLEGLLSKGNKTQDDPSFVEGTLTYNGFTYATIKIGTQEWTVENLRTTKYNDGTSITNITSNSSWSTTTVGAYSVYENNESNVATYGYFYNWYAVNTGKLAPTGWRVPSDADWTKLENSVGGSVNAGTKLKATTEWFTNTGTDDYGFRAFPRGSRGDDGVFGGIGFYGIWWSSTANGTSAWRRDMNFNDTSVGRAISGHRSGHSVRLVRDSEATNTSPTAPSNPSPATNAIDQSTSVTLSWNCSDPDGDALTYDVYFGTATTPTTIVSPNQTATSLNRSSLSGGTTYYWKVVAKDGKGGTSESPVWNFRTQQSNRAPSSPSNPSPATNAIDQSTTVTLSWSCSDPDGDALTYDVYFGTATTPTTIMSPNQTAISLSRSGLTKSTTYYWKVVSKDGKGGTAESPVWNFRTIDSPGTLTYNGFTYTTVKIGTQEWTVENLRTTKYNDGTSITNITGNSTWTTTTSGAYCVYDNNESNVVTYGYLYNWYAVNTGKLVPATGGWRIPSEADIDKLIEVCGGDQFSAGYKLKSQSGWTGNGNGSDEFGFKALPGGERDHSDGKFNYVGETCNLWSTKLSGATGFSYNVSFDYRDSWLGWNTHPHKKGYSVRLVRDL